MNEFCLRLIVRLVRVWTRLYTTGTLPDVRDRRRAEIESDIWESLRQPHSARLPVQMMSRLLRGVFDDLAWRRSCRRPSAVARRVTVAILVAIAFAAGRLLATGRAAVLPTPAPLVQRARPLPPPPPPPPPPCPPPGTGRTPPTPCER